MSLFDARKGTLKKLFLDRLKGILDSPIQLLGVIAFLLFIISTIVVLVFFHQEKRMLLSQLVSELYGTTLDIIILGILVIWLTSAIERKRKIEVARDEIDDLRYWIQDRNMVMIGRMRSMNESVEVKDKILHDWQVSYSALKIVRHIKTLSREGITGLNLSYCKIHSMNLDGLRLRFANIDMGDFSFSSFVRVDLYDSTLCSGHFRFCDFGNANLRYCKANGADFTNSLFTNTDMSYGSFIGVSFQNARLHDTSFVNANLKGADFSGAIIVGVNFSHAIGLTANQLSKAQVIVRCILPEGVEKDLEVIKMRGSALSIPQRDSLQGQEISVK